MLKEMSLPTLDKVDNQSYDCRKKCYQRDFEIASALFPDKNGVALSSKSFMANDSQVPSYSRISFRGFRGSYGLAGAKAHTLQIILMDFARVVATRCWSRPSKDLFSLIRNYGHGVARFNISNVRPTQNNRLGGINNFNSLIEEDDLGFMHYQVDATSETDGPSNSGNTGSKITYKESLQVYPNKQQNQEVVTKSAGFATKSFRVAALDNFFTHIAVFSHKLGSQSV